MLQIAFSGKLMRRLGRPLALAALPVVAGALLLAIAASPNPTMVAWAEITRKVITRAVMKSYFRNAICSLRCAWQTSMIGAFNSIVG